jgi:hypothetical protein
VWSRTNPLRCTSKAPSSTNSYLLARRPKIYF